MCSPKYPNPDAASSLLSASIILIPTVCLRPGASEAPDDGRGGAAAAACAGHESGGGGEGRVALPAPGRARLGISLHLALSAGMVGHFPGRREDFGGCARPVHAPATAPGCSHCVRHPKLPAGRWRHGLSLLPAPCPRTGRDSTRLRPVQPPRSQGEPGGGSSGFTATPPQTWLPSSAEGFWSKLASFLLPSCGGFRRRCLSQRCGLCGGWGASSIPEAVHQAGGSAGPGAPSHCWSFQTGLEGALENSTRRS